VLLGSSLSAPVAVALRAFVDFLFLGVFFLWLPFPGSGVFDLLLVVL
jgi:hypothetical protein